MFKAWKPTALYEKKVFIGLMLHMGVVNLSIIQVYWSSDWFIQSSTVWKNVMSRESFLLLQRIWHFDNPNATESRLQKISPLMDHFNQTMDSIYCKKDLSFHESMVLRRSCLKFRLYIKGKRHKYGVKLYKLCESTNLIMRSIDKYSGISYPNPKGCGQTEAIFMNLMSSYLGKDTPYIWLIMTNTYISCTLQSDQKGNPKQVVKPKLKRGETT